MADQPEQYRVERLDPDKHRRGQFNCESAQLAEFLQKRARKEMDARTSVCFVLIEQKDPGRIVGFYTLSQTSIEATQLPESLTRKLPRYPELGATLIGRLARDINWRGQSIGRLLLIDALRRCVRVSAEVGAVVVVTDPKDLRARAFYERFGFRSIDERRLFLPMKELMEREVRGWEA
jgi:predicted N-acetyltransferase YhbS